MSILSQHKLTCLLAVVGTACVTEPDPDLSNVDHDDAPSAIEARPSCERGDVVSASRVRMLTAAQAADELTSSGFDASEVRYGVDTYQVVYRTIDPQGQPTTASGLVALPHGGPVALQAVSYTHGTEVARIDAPSAQEQCRAGTDLSSCPDAWAVAPAITFASAGFAAVAPDYLGLGVGPGFHPWMDVPSETTAALDLLRAAGRVAAQRGRILRRDTSGRGRPSGARTDRRRRADSTSPSCSGCFSSRGPRRRRRRRPWGR